MSQVPGSPGNDGAAGADGINAYSATTLNFLIPALGATVVVSVTENSWMMLGQILFVQNGGTDSAGYFKVTAKPADTTFVTLEYLDYPINTKSGNVVLSGSGISPGGVEGSLSAPLPNAITDNSTGTASDTIAAGTGVFTLAIPILLAQIGGSVDVLTNYTPGFAFKILSVDSRVTTAVTTAAKLASLNVEINATNLTGGVVDLTSANCTPLGAAIAGTAVTAANTGSATDTISIEASGVTAFAEGAVVLLVRIQNMDTANAVASLADHINDLITALT